MGFNRSPSFFILFFIFYLYCCCSCFILMSSSLCNNIDEFIERVFHLKWKGGGYTILHRLDLHSNALTIELLPSPLDILSFPFATVSGASSHPFILGLEINPTSPPSLPLRLFKFHKNPPWIKRINLWRNMKWHDDTPNPTLSSRGGLRVWVTGDDGTSQSS